MSAICRRLCLAAGIILGGPVWSSAWAQVPPPPPGPPLPAVNPAFPGDGAVVPPGLVPEVTNPPGCTCGARHGVDRWWWHRTRCKRHLQEHFLGYPEEFNEWPLGASVYAHGRTQVANGEAAQMVFYHYDFRDGTSQLNERGLDKLIRVSAQLPTNFSPVLVERTPRTPGLDQSRRLALVSEFARGPFPVPAERVVIGRPIATGLNGQESVILYGNQLNQFLSGGVGGSASGSFSSFNGGGLSGSAVTGTGR